MTSSVTDAPPAPSLDSVKEVVRKYAEASAAYTAAFNVEHAADIQIRAFERGLQEFKDTVRGALQNGHPAETLLELHAQHEKDRQALDAARKAAEEANERMADLGRQKTELEAQLFALLDIE
jgi:hypothetical protein